MRVFWAIYGATILLALLGWGIWLAVSTKARQRATAGGRVVAPMVAGGVLIGLGALASARYTDGQVWPLLPGMAVFIGGAHRHRKRLLGVDQKTLRPSVRSFVEGPSLTDLLRHPIATTKRNLTLIRRGLSPSTRAAEKEWERERGLR